MKYHARLTERWGQSSYDFDSDVIAFLSIKDAADFMRVALHSQLVTVNDVKYCDDGCGHYHECGKAQRAIDIEQETAHLDLYIAGGAEPVVRLVYGPRGGIIRENF